jgi:hypothetical protein
MKLQVIRNGTVRDAENAVFDPTKLHLDDIYGHATLSMMGALGALSAGGAIIGNNYLASEDKKQFRR